VVTERPPLHLPHDVVLFGGHHEDVGYYHPIQGLACHVDCGDEWPRDLAFVFTEIVEDDPVLVANIGLHEVAHAWGLDHIAGTGYIMYRLPDTGPIEWATECTDYGEGPTSCEWAHEEVCDEQAGQQNSFAELMALFGPFAEDRIAPEVTILEPEDGLEREIGLLDIEVEVQDDRGGVGWMFEIPELEWEFVAFNGESTAEVALFDPGTYTVRVEAIDHDRNVGAAEVTVEVAPPEELDDPTSYADGVCVCEGLWRVRPSGWAARCLGPHGSSPLPYVPLALSQ
jgi:hypothetical protein